jgi:hypothetical protein
MNRMLRARPFALALAAIAALASCDSAAPLAPPDDGPRFTTGAALAAPAGFSVARNPTSGRVDLSWRDGAGEDMYLVQWRAGDGPWRSLVSTGRDRTSYTTDSISHRAPNVYRVAAMTADWRIGPFSTDTLVQEVRTGEAQAASDSTTLVTGYVSANGQTVTVWFEWSTDSLFARAEQVPARPGPGRYEAEIPAADGTRYYYRIAGVSVAGAVYGSIASYLAGAPSPPVLTAYFSTVPHPNYSQPYRESVYYVSTSWTHDGRNLSAFRLQRRLVGTESWVQLIATDERGNFYFDDSVPLTSDLQYDYRVLACDVAGNCTPSAPVRVTTRALPAPGAFTAERMQDGRVLLRWQDTPVEEEFFVQWRAGETGSWQTLFTAASGFTSQVTTRVTAGVTNYYRIAGQVPIVRHGIFRETSLAPGAGLSLTAQTGGATFTTSTAVTLSGTVTPNGLAATAWMEWGTDPALAGASRSNGAEVGAGMSPVTVTTPISLPTGATYYYRLAASNSQGTVYGAIRSISSNFPAAAVPSAAFDLAAYRVAVSWTHSGAGAPTTFRVQRRVTGQTAWAELSTQPGSARGYFDTSFPATAARAYDYRVLACNAAAECTPSGVTSAQTQPLAVPAGIAAVRNADGQVTVSWQDITGEAAYLVQWRTDPNGTWKNLVTTGANRTQFTTSSFTTGVTNYYRVAGEASGFRQGNFTQPAAVAP